MPMTLGWVDIRIGTKGKWRSVVSLAKVWESHRGVNDTAVQVTALSITPLCMSQRCNWHRCTQCTVHCHSCVNETAVPCAAESDFLIKTVCRIIREDIRKKFGCTSGSWIPTLFIIFANSKPYSKRL
jgi:hypothetical protein